MYALTRELARYIDEYVPRYFKMPLSLLMENAGRGVAETIYQFEQAAICEGPLEKFVLFLCGVGNNGADGLVAARHLKEQGIPVKILIVGHEINGTPLFREQLDIIKALGIDTESLDSFFDWSQVAVLVEALVGTGFVGTMRKELGLILHKIDIERTQYGFPLWAIDVPAGTDATNGYISDYTLSYDGTVTFGAIKTGLLLYPGKERAGTVVVAPLGIPWYELFTADHDNSIGRTTYITLDKELVEPIIHYRSAVAHKGINGSILVVGGSTSMVGAPIISGNAAVRSGAGKVSLAVPQSIQTIVQSKILPEVMVNAFTNDDISYNSIDYNCFDVLAIGPGLGRTTEVNILVDTLLTQFRGPKVIDADALFALGTIGEVHTLEDGSIRYDGTRQFEHSIMTPHVGEFGRLIGKSTSFVARHYLDLAIQFSVAHDVILVLKGIPTLVAMPTGYVYINTLGNAGMGAGGMGDALTGIIGALIGQGYSLQDSALLGVYLHSRSADILREEKEWGYTPSEVAAHVGVVIKELLEG
ncbi:NAD(P)H-hydrate dehydratase [Veillonella agrestimuris]|uniref:NAD(P)H-hydrate dehydratase n=1 Tax=Veillonella agrestimuris TaxID=2941340 RepID=UPI0020415CE7|nr:NAD(P)H-hydrate dehydratase [Veillonella agrestimuris]